MIQDGYGKAMWTCHSFSIKFTKVIGNFKNLFGKLGLFRGLVNKEKTFVVF